MRSFNHAARCIRQHAADVKHQQSLLIAAVAASRRCRQPFSSPDAQQSKRLLQQAQCKGHRRALPLKAQQQWQQPVDAASFVPDGAVSVVLVSGGVGKRFGATIPKQYVPLLGQPIATYSLETYSHMREVGEIVVVCDPSWRHVFEKCHARLERQVPLTFAEPGPERQDSVRNGFEAVRAGAVLVAIHDAARPLLGAADASRCFHDGWTVGAAVLGVPVTSTIKQVDGGGRVQQTLKRSELWEAQTPQVLRVEVLREGFRRLAEEGSEVTDDVSLVEGFHPVQITPGSYTNIKVTTPTDMTIAEGFFASRKVPEAARLVESQETAAAAAAAAAASAAA